MDTVLWLAFATGFLGGFGHCIGMCGPLVAAYALPSKERNGVLGALKPHLIYSAGRITTYSFIGFLMGLTGTFVDTAGRLAGIQNLVALLAGIFMIAAGLRIAGVWKASPFAENRGAGILKAARFAVEDESVWRYYPLGVLLGFMPCGLSYTVFIGAAGTGGPLPGMATMICFGIGTVPAMVLFGSFITLLGNKARGRFFTAGGVAVVLMGVFFLARGLRLYG